MTTGDQSFTKTGRLRRATLKEVATWVLESWKGISKCHVINGFRKAEITSPDASSETTSSGEGSDVELHPSLCFLFRSDTESENFSGFEDCDL